MGFQSSALVLLACISSAVAFVPRSITGPRSTWGLQAEKMELVLDSDFDDINVVRLMGLQRMKKLIRKNKRGHKMTALDDVAQETTKKECLKLIIAGAPASGKGTQCETIKSKYGVVHLSTGDMLRAAVAAGTDVGKKAKEFMDSGKLVPDEVIIGVVSGKVENHLYNVSLHSKLNLYAIQMKGL